jgi:hypothetical protein
LWQGAGLSGHAAAFFAGLASGLLGMLSTIMRPMLAAMDGRDFRNFMEAFLRVAEHSWGRMFNYAWSIGMTIGPSSRSRSSGTIPAPPRSCSPRSAWASLSAMYS